MRSVIGPIRIYGAERVTQTTIGLKAFRSVLWAGLGRVVRAGSQVLFLIMLGQAVGPSGFAAASIALIGYQLVITVASQSFAQALVRYDNEDHGRDAAAFCLNCLFSLSFALIIVGVSALTAHMLNLPDLVWLMPQLALVATLVAPTVIAQANLSRAMNFKHIAAIESLSAAVSVAAGILSILIWGANLQALVIYAASQRIVEFVAFMRHRSSWPVALPVRQALAPLMNFTGPLISVQILTFANNSVDQFFVGRANNPTQLGLFSLGRRLTQQPTQMISFAVGRAIFPALVKARDTEEGPNGLFLTSLRMTALASSAPLLFFAVIASDLVRVALGPEWTSTGPFLSLFAVSSVAVPLGAIFAAALRAEGKTGTQLLLQIIRLFSTIIVLGGCVLLEATVWTMAWAVAFITFTSILPPAIVSMRHLGIPIAQAALSFTKGIFPIAGISASLAALNLTVFSTFEPELRIMVSTFWFIIALALLLLTKRKKI